MATSMQIGRPLVQVAADHEVYLSDPSVLTAIVLETQVALEPPNEHA